MEELSKSYLARDDIMKVIEQTRQGRHCYFCGCCGENVDKVSSPRFCKYCGQRLSWEGVNNGEKIQEQTD